MAIRPRGPLPGWQPSRPRQRAILADLQARYDQHRREGTWPRGGRGIFYDLRPAGMGNGVHYPKRHAPPGRPRPPLGPMEADPDTVQEVLVLARRAGLIPEGLVADTRAPTPYGAGGWEDADQFARQLARQVERFRLDPQRDQPAYVEVRCEAEDLAPRLARVARSPYGVPVSSGAGYGGLKGVRELAERAAHREVPTIVLVVTDLDPHGERIHHAADEDARAWLPHYQPDRPADWLTFERIAITEPQAREAGVLDADGYAEADALPVPTLDAILRDRLDQLLPPAGRERVAVDQAAELARLPDALRAALNHQAGPADHEEELWRRLARASGLDLEEDDEP
jgi:hypothetical protein